MLIPILLLGLCTWVLVSSKQYSSSGFSKLQILTIQVAASRTQPNGRVLGVDIIPAQPPKGVSTIQGNFLSPEIQQYVLDFVRDPKRGRPRSPSPSETEYVNTIGLNSTESGSTWTEAANPTHSTSAKVSNPPSERTVDVVLSDMSAPWVQTRGFWNRSLSNPYHRMMNTSGISFRDHAGSMVSNHCNNYIVIKKITKCHLYRICAEPPLNSVSTSSNPVATLCANSIRVPKTRP
jgi:23S rRNA U2552 (ribose-2'-O)-methylase RlmE/FtsJ